MIRYAKYNIIMQIIYINANYLYKCKLYIHDLKTIYI